MVITSSVVTAPRGTGQASLRLCLLVSTPSFMPPQTHLLRDNAIHTHGRSPLLAFRLGTRSTIPLAPRRGPLEGPSQPLAALGGLDTHSSAATHDEDF